MYYQCAASLDESLLGAAGLLQELEQMLAHANGSGAHARNILPESEDLSIGDAAAREPGREELDMDMLGLDAVTNLPDVHGATINKFAYWHSSFAAGTNLEALSWHSR